MTDYTRRRVIKMAGVLALTTLAGEVLCLPSLQAAMPARTAAGLADFTQLSQQLTMNAALDDAVAQALFTALALNRPRLADELAALASLLTAQPTLLEQPLLAFPAGHEAEAATAKAILTGWYTGVVGKGNQAIYVTYVNTLANQAVSDTLVPPSFSYGPCGSWAKQP
ncbi:sugar dehydrogenase complex small subunit [Nissabacter sp. SGAir0207]|uniref:sugar dehydrogenase complex small subunit n=1 Tax=Nissabacter sp. SGAir0207 TaxID=2126321 RepID=UPI0010CD00DA|nr:sugar dehydrogenase complex small subunit [Nissabacter sp. SGAir0207]QCR38562.1 hypothetical protein C1N62_20785 [Nissabacter sp. SGAir0207]